MIAEPPLSPRQSTHWSKRLALWGHVLHAAAVHAEDAVCAVHLLHQSHPGEPLPAGGYANGCSQPHHHHPPGLLIR